MKILNSITDVQRISNVPVLVGDAASVNANYGNSQPQLVIGNTASLYVQRAAQSFSGTLQKIYSSATSIPLYSSTADGTISEIANPSEGRVVIISNYASYGGNRFWLKHDTGASSAANTQHRIWTASYTDICVGPGENVVLLYDSSITRWRVISQHLSSHEIFKSKNVEEVVTNSAVLQNDDDLQFFAPANTVWSVDVGIWYSISIMGGIKVVLTAPSLHSAITSNVIESRIMTQNSTIFSRVGNTSNSQFGTITASPTDAAPHAFFMRYIVPVGSVGGIVAFQFSQETAYAGNSVKVKQGSYLNARRTA